MVFHVLRDPPGGDSFAYISSGTQVSFSMSIENMKAHSGNANKDDGYSAIGDNGFTYTVNTGSTVATVQTKTNAAVEYGHAESESKVSISLYTYISIYIYISI